jgi:predicted alpha/beta hydrolase family esterase
MTTTRRSLLAGSAAVAAGLGVRAQPRPDSTKKPTVVLVHGAFADASGWNAVAAHLIRAGYPVIAPANPLCGVAADATYLASVLATLGGPLVLAAHSYGGNVITNAATGNANVHALVYVAAFTPDQGSRCRTCRRSTREARSWYLIARDDNVFPAAAQRFVAQRAGAHTVEVGTSHVAMIAHPAATADLIKRAASR